MKKPLQRARTLAKELKLLVAEGNPMAIERCRAILRDFDPARGLTLSTAQLIVARECGFDSWTSMLGEA